MSSGPQVARRAVGQTGTGRRARFALVVDGVDHAAAIAPHLFPGRTTPLDAQGKPLVPRLQSISISERLSDAADQVDIVLSNHDGLLQPIRRGVYLDLSLGWVSGPDVPTGLVDKGRFLVDEVEKSGPPDQVRIRARSADLTSDYRRRRDKGWKGTTLGAVLREIAGANGLSASVDPALAAIAIPSIEQAAKSDMAFVRDLGARYDAVATVKDKTLIFLPIGATANAGGQSFAAITLTRRNNSRWTFNAPDRDKHDGAQAQWHDRGAARKQTVTAGGTANPKRIKRHFASEGEARAAAQAEARKAARGEFEFQYQMALGDPGIEPNMRVTLQGWDSEIDAISWLVDEATHTLDGTGGLTSALKLVSVAG